jgi:hypothetical protein
MGNNEIIVPEVLTNEDNIEEFELDINAIFSFQNESQSKVSQKILKMLNLLV